MPSRLRTVPVDAPPSRLDGLPAGPLLLFDGSCPFCRHFALVSELRGGIPGLQIRDGRADHHLRDRLERQGRKLRDGALLIVDGHLLHGAEAIQWLCSRMAPSDALLQLLAPLLASPERTRRLYPLLLLARRAALALQGLPVDPGEAHGSRRDRGRTA